MSDDRTYQEVVAEQGFDPLERVTVTWDEFMKAKGQPEWLDRVLNPEPDTGIEWEVGDDERLTACEYGCGFEATTEDEMLTHYEEVDHSEEE